MWLLMNLEQVHPPTSRLRGLVHHYKGRRLRIEILASKFFFMLLEVSEHGIWTSIILKMVMASDVFVLRRGACDQGLGALALYSRSEKSLYSSICSLRYKDSISQILYIHIQDSGSSIAQA